MVSDPYGPAWLTALAAHTNSMISAIAVGALGSGRDPVHQPILVRALSDREAGMRHYLPRHNLDPLVRRVVVGVLGQRADPSDIRRLTDALKDTDELFRSRATAALGRITHEKTLPLLTEALRDPRPRVRVNAATALGRTAPDGLRALLADALADPHVAVRSAATAALRAGAGRLSSVDDELVGTAAASR